MAKQDDYVRYTIRVPADLYEKVKNAAGEKSVNAEIIDRLEQSFAPTDLFAMGKALAADENDPQALASEKDVDYRSWLHAITQLYAPKNTQTDAQRPRRFEIEHLRPDTGSDIVRIDEDGLATLIQSKVSNALDNTLASVTEDILRQWAQQLIDKTSVSKVLTPREAHELTSLANATAPKKMKLYVHPELERRFRETPVFRAVPDSNARDPSSTPVKSDPRAGTSLSTKPVKGKGIRIDRRYTRPAMSAYERLRQSARDAEASKAELEALQAKFPATPNIAPLSAPNMEVLLRTGVRPAKVPETVEKALTLRKSAAKESRIRDPNEPRPIRTRKKAPKDENSN